MSTTDPVSPGSSALGSPPVSSVPETRVDGASDRVVELFGQTRPWALQFSVLGFIAAGITICAAAVQAINALGLGRPRAMGEAMGMLFIGVVYFYPSLHLFRFASRIRDLSETRRLADLEAAVQEQKSFWKFCGVAVSIMLAFYVLLMLGAFLLGGRR